MNFGGIMTITSIFFLALALTVTPVFADDYQKGMDAHDQKDYKTAFEKWKPLAEMGHTPAQHSLGFLYHVGKGVTKNYKEAVKWYRLSAEKGFAKGQNSLGLMYEFGKGVTKDYKEAVKWYRLSAEQGFVLAQVVLGTKYASGQGVVQDYVEADKWFHIAETKAHEIASKYRVVIEKKMTPAQIAKAQKLANEWIEKQN